MIGLVAFADGHDPLAVRRDPGRGEVESGGGQQGPVLARARVDDHDVLAQPAAAIVNGPSGDGHPPVRGQLEAVLIQGPARLGGQVPRGDLGPGAQRVGDQQPQLVRAEVMVPVPDQGRFVQDGRHARVGAGPALLPVRGGPAGAGQRRRGERGPPRAGSAGQLADAPGGCGDLAGLPGRGRQQPQRPLPGSIVPPASAWLGAGAGSAGPADRNSSPPSGRKAGLSSPSADQVSLAGAAARPQAPVSTRQMLGLNVRPSGARADTVTASQLPSGASLRPVSRGRAR